jgi:hypothetical protein
MGSLTAGFTLNSPAGIFEYPGEQRFGALPSFSCGRFLGFLQVLHNASQAKADSCR